MNSLETNKGKPKQGSNEAKSRLDQIRPNDELVDIKKDVEALREKILEITEIINVKFPELVKFLDEMPLILPNDKHTKVSLQDLSEYYQSLDSVLKKYEIEQDNKPGRSH